MYRKWSKGKEFPRMHVLTKLEKCPKWEKTRLTEVIDVEEGGGAPSVGSVGCPIGNKKAKAKRNGDGTAPWATMGASIDMLIAEVVSS
jgi:predicted nucleic acid-binding Zn ribbon protein